ncbi:hypothetical protein P3T25_000555 [Paraburkholderia sp. GAS32]
MTIESLAIEFLRTPVSSFGFGRVLAYLDATVELPGRAL